MKTSIKIIIIILTINILLTLFNIFLAYNKSNNIYTFADLIVIKNHIMETDGFEFSDYMIEHYDINNDGKITSADYVKLKNILIGKNK